MKTHLAGLGWLAGLMLSFAAPAAAQVGPCLVSQRGLDFNQWYQICGGQVAQLCSFLPMQPQTCAPSVAQAEYQTYSQSQYVSMACSVPGEMRCINGWRATCNGSLFMTSANRC